MRTLPILLGLLVSASAAAAGGCSSSPSPVAGERIGQATLPIINGSPDATHPAVVALFSNQGECTGTIFQVSGSTGYVLTAAHCCTPAEAPQVVVQGTDYNAGSAIQYNVTAYKADPAYNQQIHDFCVVTFSGASGATPTIPLMSKANDNLQLGDIADFVGFGVTNGADPNNMNSQRLHVKQPLDQQLTVYTLEYSQTNSGPCAGDSGGPSLSVVGGVEYVSGVTSYGDQTCVQYGVSGRVSAVYDSFILPVVNGQPPVQDCNGCASGSTSGQGACVPQTEACLADADCKALAGCFNGCQSQPCIDACASQHPTGVVLYNKINDCICTQACVAECAVECGGSSSSSSSSGATSTSSSGATSTSSSSGGAGGGTSSGQTTSGGFGGDGTVKKSAPVETGGCALSTQGGDEAPSPLGGLALAGVAAAIVALRRRASR